ncbi:MAG: hypothetical protein HOG49_43380 [Candidatus Scalindua sp.]|nr:hypothetical protein [Candidatus Scalindua sp.]
MPGTFQELQTQSRVNLYNQNPAMFALEDVDRLELDAQEFGVQFQRNMDFEEAKLQPSVTSHINQFTSGLLEGFTTFGYANDPTSSSESIAHSLGHLIGFAPGILAGPLGFAAKQTGVRALGVTAGILGGATKIGIPALGKKVAIKSVPFMAADKAIDIAGKLAKDNSYLATLKFLDGATKTGRVGRHMIHGAAHLGVASATSSWQGGIDEMFSSFVSGGIAGGAFAGMGNYIKLKGMFKDPKTVKNAEKVVRGMAGSMFMGLPMTLQDAPTSMQIYNYLLGGFFGATTGNAQQFEASRWSKDKKAVDFIDVENQPGFARLSDEAKGIVMDQALLTHGKILADGVQEAEVIMATALNSVLGSDTSLKDKLVKYQEMRDQIKKIDPTPVPGDYLKLEKGDPVPENAEIVLIDSLTGQRYYKPKKVEAEKKVETPEKEQTIFEVINSDDVLEHKKGWSDQFVVRTTSKSGKGEVEKISGKPIKLENDSDFEWILTREQGHYAVVEKNTGMQLSKGLTQKEAIANGEATIKKYPEYRETINRYPGMFDTEKTVVAPIDPKVDKSPKEDIPEIADNDIERDLLIDSKPDERTAVTINPAFTGLLDSLVKSSGDPNEISKKLTAITQEVVKNKESFEALLIRVGAINKDGGTLDASQENALRQFYINQKNKNVVHEELITVVRDFEYRVVEGEEWKGEQWVPIAYRNQTEKRGVVDMKNRRIVKIRPMSMLDVATDGKKRVVQTYNLNTRRLVDGKFQNDWSTGDIYDSKTYEKDIAGIMEKQYQDGFVYHSGVKDHDTFMFVPGDVAKKDVGAQFERALKIFPGLKKQLEKQHKLFAEKFFDDPKGQNKRAKEIYSYSFVNNMAYFEKLNGGKPIEEMVAANKLAGKEGRRKPFLFNVQDFNTRMQLWDAGERTLEADVYTNADGSPTKTMKVVIINGINLGGDRRIYEGKEPIMFDLAGEGKRPAENHMDSPVWVTPERFDQMLKDAGLPWETTKMKGVIRHANKKQGALLSKLLYVIAPKEMAAEMRRIGADFLLSDTSVKQTGERQSYDRLLTNKNTVRYSQKDKEIDMPEGYDLPLDAFTINNGVYENVKSFMKDQIQATQLLSNMNSLNVDPKIMKEFMERTFTDVVDGKKTVNDAVTAGNESALFDGKKALFDINDISLKNIIDIAQGTTDKTSRLYEEVWRQLKKLDKVDPDEIDADAAKGILKSFQVNETTDGVLSRNWPISPASIQMPFTATVNNALLAKYVVKRVIKPTLKHSGKAFMIPYDEYLQRDYDLKEGEIYLEDYWKEKEVNIRGEKMTLGEAWELRQAGKLTDKDMEWVALRVPSSSIAGSRVLTFKGFLNRRGAGALFHPRDMEELGGADLDGDTSFLYQDIPEALRGEIKKSKDLWTRNGQMLGVKRDEIRRALKIYPVHKDDLTEGLTFDPHLRLEMSENAYAGKRLVGKVNNLKKRLMVLESMADKDGTVRLPIDRNIKDIEDVIDGDYIEINFHKGQEIGYKEKLHSLMNFAVDAAKEARVDLDVNNIYDTTFTMKVIDGKNVSTIDFDKVKPKFLASLLNSSLLGRLQDFDSKIVNGYDFESGKAFDLKSKAESAKELKRYIEDHGLSRDHSVYKQAIAIADMKYDPRMENWLNIDNAKKMLKDMNNIFSKNTLEEAPGVDALKDLIYRTVYPTFNENQDMKNGQFTDNFYGKILSLASTKELFKISRKILKENPDDVVALREIASQTNLIKNDINKLVMEKSNQEFSSEYRTTDSLLAEKDAQVKAYRDSLPERHKEFFDQWLIGSLWAETTTQAGDAKTFNYGFNHPSVGERAIKKLGATMSSLVETINRGENDKFISGLIGKTDLSNFRKAEKQDIETSKKLEQPTEVRETAQEAIEYIVLNKVKKTKLDKVKKDIAETRKKIKTGKQYEELSKRKDELGKEGIKLLERLENMLRRYPKLQHDFPGKFSGTLAKRVPGGIEKQSVDMKIATFNDLRDFLDTMDFLGGKKQKFLSPNRRDYSYMPSYASNRMSKFELNWFETTAAVKGLNGIIRNRKVFQPMSSLGRDIEYTQRITEFNSEHSNHQEALLNKDFAWLERYGVEGEDLFNIAISRYEKELGDHRIRSNYRLYRQYNKEMEEVFGKHYKDRVFTHSKGNRKTELTAEEIITRIIDTHIKGNDGFYNEWIRKIDKDGGYADEWKSYRDRNGHINIDKALTVLMKQVFTGDKKNHMTLDAISELGHEVILNNIELRSKLTGKLTLVKNMSIGERDETLKTYKKNYGYRHIGAQRNHFAHNGHPAKVLKAHRKEMLKKMARRKASKQEISDESQRLLSQIADQEMFDMNLSYPLKPLLIDGKVTEASIEQVGLSRRPGHAQSRNTEAGPMPGWERSTGSLRRYRNQIVKGYSNILLSLGTHRNIQNFESKNLGGADTAEWVKFMRLRSMVNLGYPSVIPTSYLEGKNSIIKKTPFYWFSDQNIEQKMLKYSKAVGIKPWWDPKRPEEFYYKLRTFSNLEAKYSLMTLLARPKAMVNNLYGGMTFTAVETGYQPFAAALSLKKVQEILPGGEKFKSWDDVYRWADKMGANEEWIASMIGTNPIFKTAKWQRFFARAIEGRKSNPDMPDKNLFEIAKEEGLSDSIVKNSAWFMRKAEHKLRMTAFLAHYIKGMGSLYGDKAKYHRNDSVLVQYALKGVEASQFLYNNNSRPLFSGTNMGKVYSRFQLWGWKALARQINIASSANAYGFRPGTEEYQRFRRMITADMFVMALGTLFTASLFESTMPPPYSYLQDFAGLLFGDKRERERAFFGTLPGPLSPIQALSPPSARLLLQPLGNLMKGDWERFIDYQVWSWLPFGLLGRDIKRSAENPTMAVQNMFGVPVHGLHRKLKNEREKFATSPRLFYSKPETEEPPE